MNQCVHWEVTQEGLIMGHEYGVHGVHLLTDSRGQEHEANPTHPRMTLLILCLFQ